MRGVGVSLRQVGVRAHQGCSAVSLAVTLSSLSCVGTWGLRCVDVNMALSSGGITIVPRSPPNLLRFESRGREVMRYSAVSVSGERGREGILPHLSAAASSPARSAVYWWRRSSLSSTANSLSMHRGEGETRPRQPASKRPMRTREIEGSGRGIVVAKRGA